MLIDLSETIKKAIDDIEFACGVILDFKKVFHTVNHGILSKNLELYGVRGHALKWFTSYHAGRKQYTKVNKVILKLLISLMVFPRDQSLLL